MSKVEWDKALLEDYPYPITIRFDSGEREAEQNEWIEESLKHFGFTASQVLAQRRGACHYSLAFKNFSDFAKFRLEFLGDSKDTYSKCVVNFPAEINPHWMMAAESFLKTHNLKPEIEASNNQVIFKFQYFGEMARFRIAVENNEIDHMAATLNESENHKSKNTNIRPKPILGNYNPVD